MKNRESVIDRIRKLLSLADEQGGGADAERALAAQRAQELIIKHRIEDAELANAEGREQLPGIVTERIGVIPRAQYWRIDLYTAIGNPVTVDAVFVVGRSGRRLRLVGRADMVAYVQLVHDWIAPQLIRECETALAARKRAAITWDSGATVAFRRSFYAGAVYSLSVRLEAALRDSAGSTGMALVRSDRAALDAHYGDHAPKTEKDRTPLRDIEGITAGHAAGERVDVEPRNKVDAGAALELTS